MATVHKFGRNASVGNGVWEDVWTVGGAYTWPQAGFTAKVQSSTAADTAAGTGARSVTIQGLTTNLIEVSETIVTSGTVASSGSVSFFRINRAYVETAGTYGGLFTGGNRGTINILTSTGGSQAQIVASTGGGTVGYGQSQVSRYTVPLGKKAYVRNAKIHVEATKPAAVVFFTRFNADTISAPFPAPRIRTFIDGVDGRELMVSDEPFGPLPGGTDMWWAAKGSGAATSVSVDYEIEVDDG